VFSAPFVLYTLPHDEEENKHFYSYIGYDDIVAMVLVSNAFRKTFNRL